MRATLHGSGTSSGCPSGYQWYAVQTKRHRESLAEVQLRGEGLEAYLPRMIQWPPPAVGGEVGAMFPGYIFARLTLPEDYYRVIWKPGVKSLLAFGEEPAVLPPEAVEFLRDQEGPDGLIRCGQGAQRVRVVRGPFKGLTALVERRLSGKQRVIVLMELLSNKTRVELPESYIGLA